MNATSIQPDPNDRAELARLLPGPAERDLPSDRHQRLQEFVMSQIHQDLRSAEQAAGRSPKRKPALLIAALTSIAGVTAAAVVIGTGGSGTSRTPGRPGATTAQSLSGRQVLLAAATTAEREPQGSGTYWHVKTVYTKTVDGQGGGSVIETWTRRDGRSWVRTGAPDSPVKDNSGHGWNDGFVLGTTRLSYQQIQRLPADSAALKTWIKRHSSLMRAAGKPIMRLDKHNREKPGPVLSSDNVVAGALIGFLSSAPAPPKVRAAAFRALASLPDVRNLGPVKGGLGLLISDADGTSRLVIDPATSRVHSSSFADAGKKTSGTTRTDAAEWTDLPPR